MPCSAHNFFQNWSVKEGGEEVSACCAEELDVVAEILLLIRLSGTNGCGC